MIRALDRGGNELVKKVLARISSSRSGLRCAEDSRNARIKQGQPASF
jgi:hypothetical protein